MPSISSLKQDIQFNDRLAGLLDALKSIAAQQFQALERTFRVNPAFFSAIETIAGTFDLEHIAHPFTQPRGPTGVIAVTSGATVFVASSRPPSPTSMTAASTPAASKWRKAQAVVTSK